MGRRAAVTPGNGKQRHPSALASDTVVNQRISDLSEEQLLARILPHFSATSAVVLGPGDDAAVLAAPDGRVVVTTDVLVEGQHFRRGWIAPEQLGRRAIAQNFADVAAMGATPTGAVVALVAPGATEVAWVEGVARGLGEACRAAGASIVGGDLSNGEQVAIAVTAFGDLGGEPPVLRSGAAPGDVVALAGNWGAAAAGLALLSAGQTDVAPHLVAAHLVPDPPLSAGPIAREAGATALMDVSDGLLRDAGRLAAASQITIDLIGSTAARAAEKLRPAALALGIDPLTWVLTGGEDHGLLATFPANAVLPPGFTVIGRATADAPPGTVLIDGTLPPDTAPGWDHFKP